MYKYYKLNRETDCTCMISNASEYNYIIYPRHSSTSSDDCSRLLLLLGTSLDTEEASLDEL